jgi:hypothetical protein
VLYLSKKKPQQSSPLFFSIHKIDCILLHSNNWAWLLNPLVFQLCFCQKNMDFWKDSKNFTGSILGIKRGCNKKRPILKDPTIGINHTLSVF